MGKNPKVISLWVLLLTGCGGLPKPKNGPVEPTPLLDAIARKDASLKSLTAEIDVEIWQKGERVKFRQFLAADDQGRLRIEVISPFGNPIMTLTSDGSRLMIFDSKEGRFFLGAVTQDSLARLLPVPMSPSELSTLLRGAIPRLVTEQKRLEWDSTKGRYKVILTTSDRSQSIYFEPDHYRVTMLVSRFGGVVRYRALMGNYTGTDDAALPRRVRFEVPGEDLRIDMKIKEVSLNPSLSPEVFTLSPPRGIVVEPIP